MTNPTLQNVIDDIRRNLKAVHAPSADCNWLNELAGCFDGYPIVDCTDLDYDRSHFFIIVIANHSSEKFIGTIPEEIELLRRLEGHAYYVLWLRLSVVVPYYIVGLMRRMLGATHLDQANKIKRSSKISALDEEIVDTDVLPRTGEQADLLRKAHAFARDRGFTSIPRDYLEQLVLGVELDRAEPQKVTVFNCLFADDEWLP